MSVDPAGLIVGAAGGIGQEISTTVAAQGYRLTLAGRRARDARALASDLDPDGRRALPAVADLLDPAAAAALVAEHLDHHGRLDLVISTAGVAQHRALAEIDIERSRTVIDVNVGGTVALLAAELPALREAAGSRPGALVVLLSSVAATRPVAGYAMYSATKAAVSSLVRSVNEEENQNGVRATAISPGFVDSAFTAGLPKRPGEFLPTTDIAEAVRFLLQLSPLARVPALEISRTNTEMGRP